MKGTADRKLAKYIDRLYARKKKTLLGSLKKTKSRKGKTISSEQYNKELEDADAEIDRGIFYTHEEVLEMIQKMIQAGRNI